jgi:HSP20 family molecular chaperone IbpA
MTEIVVSPNICTFNDENLETLNIQVELPGVDKEDIELNSMMTDFTWWQRKKAPSTCDLML